MECKEAEMINELVGVVRNVEDAVGRMFCKIEKDWDELRFYFTSTNFIKMYHEQDCCESVSIDDICGDLEDLVGSRIVCFEEVTSESVGFDRQKVVEEADEDDFYYENSETWTFYRIQTERGDAVIRWYGSSNGYYSESVDMCVITGEEEKDDD